MNALNAFLVAILLFMVFSIGFNIGMHGLIDVHGPGGSVELKSFVMNELEIVEREVEELIHRAKMADDDKDKEWEANHKGTVYKPGPFKSKANDFDHIAEAKKQVERGMAESKTEFREHNEPPTESKKTLNLRKNSNALLKDRLHAQDLKREEANRESSHTGAKRNAVSSSNRPIEVASKSTLPNSNSKATTPSSPSRQSRPATWTRLAVDEAAQKSNALFKRAVADVAEMPHIEDRDDISEYVDMGYV